MEIQSQKTYKATKDEFELNNEPRPRDSPRRAHRYLPRQCIQGKNIHMPTCGSNQDLSLEWPARDTNIHSLDQLVKKLHPQEDGDACTLMLSDWAIEGIDAPKPYRAPQFPKCACCQCQVWHTLSKPQRPVCKVSEWTVCVMRVCRRRTSWLAVRWIVAKVASSKLKPLHAHTFQ